MQILQQVLFLILFSLGVYFFTKKMREIIRNIRMGREEALNDRRSERWRNLFLLALGQKKMFRNPLVAIMHLIIYAGFIIINLEVLEIVLDGLLGTHRLFAGPLGSVYNWLINAFEWLALGVIVVCIVFLIRRNLIRLPRFASKDLNGWPRSDANYILLTEIVLMLLFLFMNASDTLLQQRQVAGFADHQTGDFAVSRFLHPLLEGMGTASLIVVERVCWWLHIIGILAFLNYLPWSKHLHILLSFPNAWYARLEGSGKMTDMPDIRQEVTYAFQPELAPTATGQEAAKRFGARDIGDLSWKNLMDAYSCTECGRCSAACPANLTGKSLSPRKIMMDTRDRVEEVGRQINQHGKPQEDGRPLLGHYISEEELRACTTCNACVEECPVSISPLDIILQLRRYLVMEASQAPQEWNMMFGNIENNFAPWKFPPDDRTKWRELS